MLHAILMASALGVAAFASDDFPTPTNTEKDKSPVMPAAKAAAAFRLPAGFEVSVFASEPDVQNPIALAWDARGRLWVAENYTYAERTQRFDLRLRDRVLIFEDADGDGRFDKRKVFMDDVQMLTSVEYGLGGAWLMCPPQLLFVPDRNGDDVPDGPATVVLDGFNVPAENYHNFANGLKWGPDGWLYGRCGASAPGEVGAPGTTNAARIPLRGGLWRYHPGRKTFEALCHGTTNPWGHDWNRLGEPFFINTVNGHLWHAIPGAHFVRPHTIDPNPRAYEMIDQHADHWHWDISKDWSDSRNVRGEHDRLGGGHAHSGMMIYLGENWIDDRDKLFTLNMHGRRMNVERLERLGGGYVGKHEPDRCFAGDPWFRGIDLTYGPDGGVYVLDWSDTGECHESTGVHRTSGRIYKITKTPLKREPLLDFAKADASALVLQTGVANEWLVRTARLELADRAKTGAALGTSAESLVAQFGRAGSPAIALRALWALHSIGAASQAALRKALHHGDESVRVWAIRLLTDVMPLDTAMSHRPAPDVSLPDEMMAEFVKMAREDHSGLVRLTLASTLQRLPVAERTALAEPLLTRKEDANDHNIPLMLWYGLIPVADHDPTTLARLAAICQMPTTRRLIARRLGEDLEKKPLAVNDLIERVRGSDSEALQVDVLTGLCEALRGWRKAKMPATWQLFTSHVEGTHNAQLRERVRDLSVLFGDGRALADVIRLALDNDANIEDRRTALVTLIENRPPELRSICEKLLRVRFLNTTAVRGLSLFDDPAIGNALASYYPSFHPSERPAVIDTLASRPAFARALLDQIVTGKIPRSDVTPFHVRQIRTIGDDALRNRLTEVWGAQRESAADKREAIATLKKRLTPEVLAKADLGQGRVVYNKVCSTCHKLYGHGGDIGPDLTGSGRDNLDYLFENIIDPGATVGADFRMHVIAMKDGRVLNGIVRARTDKTLTLQTQTEALTLSRAEIERQDSSTLSLMAEGLLTPLRDDEVCDLIANLQARTQVPLPAGAK